MQENYNHLHQNGTIIWIERSIEDLPTDGRPLSKTNSLEAMYEVRRPLYASFADQTIHNDSTPEKAVCNILSLLQEDNYK